MIFRYLHFFIVLALMLLAVPNTPSSTQLEDIVRGDKDVDIHDLIRALEYGDSITRYDAAVALGKIGDRRAVEPLIKALGDINTNVRQAAAWALFKLEDSRAVEPLIKALGDINTNVREAAAWALFKLEDSRAVEPLIKALGDRDSNVREAAALALGKIGDHRAVEPLIKALGDRDTNVRQQAALALEGLDEPLGQLIQASLQGNEQARKELAQRKDPRAIEPLIKALGDINAINYLCLIYTYILPMIAVQ
jgi:HEAT repeat protein